MKATLQQVELLKKAGPTEKQVTDAKEKLLRDLETNMKQNGYLLTQLSLKYQYLGMTFRPCSRSIIS